VFGLAGSYAFGERMRSEATALLQGLELWAEKQAAGVELGGQPEMLATSFESLLRVRLDCGAGRSQGFARAPSRLRLPPHTFLRPLAAPFSYFTRLTISPLNHPPCPTKQVMDALYQVRARKADTDLAIDQLREILGLLAAERSLGVGKLEKRLEEVRTARGRGGGSGHQQCSSQPGQTPLAPPASVALAVHAHGACGLTLQTPPHHNRLPQVAQRWEGIKKGQQQVKSGLETVQVRLGPRWRQSWKKAGSPASIPLAHCPCIYHHTLVSPWCTHPQANQAERIRADIASFGGRVTATRASLRTRPYLSWATGAAAAYPAMDAAAAELAKLRKECDRFAELARMFELAGAAAGGRGV
jgi:hypothetical protein